MAYRHGELVGQLRRCGGTEHATALTRHVVGGVDCFLGIAAGLLNDLAHFAGHVAGILFLALGQHLSRKKNDLRPPRRRNQPPAFEGQSGGFHGRVYVVFAGFLEDRDDLPGIGRVPVFKGFARRGFNPLAINKIPINLGIPARQTGRGAYRLGRHKCLLINKTKNPCYRSDRAAGK